MSPCNVLYNVNEITVQDGLQRLYIKFSHCLNEYLKRKYPRYYIFQLTTGEFQGNVCRIYWINESSILIEKREEEKQYLI